MAGHLDRILSDTLTDSDILLLQLSLASHPSQEKLDAFLDGWDLDAAPMTEAVLLSYLLKMHPELHGPATLLPRLNGLLNYCRFQYLQLVGQFGTYCHALEAQGIHFLVMKGGAMKALRPDFPRWMGDIDILVHEEDFRLAADIAKQQGFTLFHSIHSIDLKKDGRSVLDLHQFVMMHTGREKAANPGFFARATNMRVFSVEAMMPCREDLLFMTLVNLTRNLADRATKNSVIYGFFDTQFLLDIPEGQTFDWQIVRDIAALTGSAPLLAIAGQFLNAVIPGLIPENELPPVPDEEREKWWVWIRYWREVLHPERERLGEFNIRKAIQAKTRPIPYVTGRLHYAAIKRMQHCTGYCRRKLD